MFQWIYPDQPALVFLNSFLKYVHVEKCICTQGQVSVVSLCLLESIYICVWCMLINSACCTNLCLILISRWGSLTFSKTFSGALEDAKPVRCATVVIYRPRSRRVEAAFNRDNRWKRQFVTSLSLSYVDLRCSRNRPPIWTFLQK